MRNASRSCAWRRSTHETHQRRPGRPPEPGWGRRARSASAIYNLVRGARRESRGDPRHKAAAHRGTLGRDPPTDSRRQGEGLPPLRRNQRVPAGGRDVVGGARRPVQHVPGGGHRGRRVRGEVQRAQAARTLPRGERRCRAGSHRPERGREDERPRPHVPARDGHRAAPHSRRRGGDRQAHRARQGVDHPGHVARARRRGTHRAARRAADGRRPQRSRPGGPAGGRPLRGSRRQPRARSDAADGRRGRGATALARDAGSARRRLEARQAPASSTPLAGAAGAGRAVEVHPADRVHRSGAAPARRLHQGRGRDRAASATGDRPGGPAAQGPDDAAAPERRPASPEASARSQSRTA